MQCTSRFNSATFDGYAECENIKVNNKDETYAKSDATENLNEFMCKTGVRREVNQ